jgi:hypothetical protein
MGAEDEYPVQKLTTAGAESVPPAPWVNINVGDEGDEIEEAHDCAWIGFLTKVDLIVRLVMLVLVLVAVLVGFAMPAGWGPASSTSLVARAFAVLDVFAFDFGSDFEGFDSSTLDLEALGSLVFDVEGCFCCVAMSDATASFVDERVWRFFGSGASADSAAFLRLGGMVKYLDGTCCCDIQLITFDASSMFSRYLKTGKQNRAIAQPCTPAEFNYRNVDQETTRNML